MEIPRNIRQIGDIERDLHLYMEDYVATFIEKIKRKNNTCIGIFLGRQAKEEEIPCLFVQGAVLAENYEIEDGRVVMTASAWNGVYEQAERCFKDVEICGWFLCSGNSTLTDIYNLKKSHSENFKSSNQICFVYDGERDEEAVYRFDSQGMHRIKGYYIYYERNEQMQEYMISLEPARKTEFALVTSVRGTSDQAARQFRNIMESKQAKDGRGVRQTSERNKKKNQEPGAAVSRLLRTVSVAALLCGAGFGMASWYKYDKMQGVKDVLAVLAGQDSIREESTKAEESSKDEEQAVVNQAPGNVYPTESETAVKNESSQPAAVGESGSAAQEIQETSGEVEESGNAEPVPAESASGAGTETAQESGQAAEAPVYEEYVVENGDTLNKICMKLYGNNEASLISEICELNGMDNADFIFEGQKLRLPKN